MKNKALSHMFFGAKGRKSLFNIITLLLVFIFLFSACNNKSNNNAGVGDQKWKSESKLKENIILENYDKDNILGDLDMYGIQVNVPKGAFSKGTKLSISKPREEVQYSKNGMVPYGSPFEFKIEGEDHRSNMPLLVKIAIDKEALKNLKEYEGFKGVHYTKETGWTYTDPIEINVDAGYVAFNIPNNLLWGTAELTEGERKGEFIKAKALKSWSESQLEGEVRANTRDMIESILVSQFNAKNKPEINKIAEEVMKELKYGNLEYGKLSNDLVNKDFKSYTANVATMIGKTFADSMEAGTMSTVFGQTGTVAAAAGYLWEGDYSGAGMKIAEAISETSPVYKVAKVAVDVVEMKIGNWKNNGIEEAYKAFKEGSNDYILFGYDVDPEDFEDVWNQMRGVARQIEMDAIKKYANSIGVDKESLSTEKISMIVQKAKLTLKEQFTNRSKQEKEIAQAEENQKEIIKQFEQWNLLKKGSSWYPEDSSIEQILERMYNQIKRIQKETGRFDLVYKNGDLQDQARGLDNIGKLKEGEMLVSDIAKLINTRYVYGEEGYQKLLKEMGYAPKVKLEVGTYEGIIIITEAPIIEYAQKALENPESVPEIKGPDGKNCEELDFSSIDVQKQIREGIDKSKNVIGKDVPLTIVITQGASKSEFKATLKADYKSAFPKYECEESENQIYKIKYNEGKVTLTNTDAENQTVQTFEGNVSLLDITGSFKISSSNIQYAELASTDVMVSGIWKVNKTK
ncbi:hypothetical protein [Clostridium sp.]|uniref:hypothetical protein n=1 Tax=Clostridium sp. TaxID=1506 RepID=UPI003D6D2640